MKIATRDFIAVISGSLITGFCSCDLINPAENIPAYLQVDTFSFTVVPGQGTSSNRITDVWVFNETDIVGAYEIPKVFPVLDSGPTQIILSAGIKDNGISETRVPYPFYFPDTLTLDLQPAETISLTPHFTYRPSTKFYFIEDFEAGNLFDQIGGDTNIVRSNIESEVFEGNYSAAIYLTLENQVYEGRSAASYALPKNQPVYLELNYKCEQEFEIGLYGIELGATVFYYKWNINPRDFWNKIYLNMGQDVTTLLADEYQILIRAVLDSTTHSSANIFLDNIKLVSF